MNRSSGLAGPGEYGVGQPSVQIEHRMLKSKRRRLLAIVVLTGLILWIGSSALVTWMFTRRSSAPFPEPTPQVAWANVEAHRLKTSDSQQLGAWLVRGDPQKGCVLLDRLIPPSRDYGHERAWHDGNGHSHLQATLMGPSLSVPVADGKPVLGTWQQIIHLECDVRPRSRTVMVTVMGE